MDTLATLSIMERILFLRRVPLFSDLPPAELKQVAAITNEQYYLDGEVIARQGEPGERGARAMFLEWRDSMADTPRKADLAMSVLARLFSFGLDREMIAVAVSSINHCYYCLTAHGAAVRQLSGDPALGEMMVMNFRAAALSLRQTARLEFAVKLTEEPAKIVEADRAALRKAGFSDRDIWDIASTAAFFNMSNRVAAAIDMRPNDEYHAMAR